MGAFGKPASASLSLRVLARLLAYPDAQLRAHLAEMRAALHAEGAIGAQRRAELDALIDSLARGAPLEVEAAYVQLFDRGRATSLHLFEHVHGDSRERGPAMIDLARTYESGGLYLAEGELPDFLPVVLQFASTREPAEAKAFLGEMTHILNAVFSALQRQESGYASVPSGYASILGALIELAGEKAKPVKVVPDEPLDEAWAEPTVFDGCSTEGQAKPGQGGPGQPQPIRIVRSASQTSGAQP